MSNQLNKAKRFAKHLAAFSIVSLAVVNTAAASDIVRRNGSNFHSYHAYSGEPVFVNLRGDGDTDLDVIVRSPSGNILRVCDGPTDRERCDFMAGGAGRYSVEVMNLGGVYNEYRLSIR